MVMALLPAQPPELPVLWVVTPSGLDLSAFPFGKAVRLLAVVGIERSQF